MGIECLFHTDVVCDASNAISPLMLCIEYLTSSGNFQSKKGITCLGYDECVNR